MHGDAEKSRSELLRELRLLRRRCANLQSSAARQPRHRASTAVADSDPTLAAITPSSELDSTLCGTHELLRTIVSKTPIVIWAVNRDGDFELSEGKALELLGLEPGEAVGRSVHDVYRDVPEVEENIRRALAGETVTAPVRIDDILFETWQSPLHNAAGEIVGAVGMAIDVTRRRQVEAELRAEQHLMQRMLRSHERDRQLVAYEIHDGMVQHATGALMHLQTAMEAGLSLPPRAREEVRMASDLIGKAVTEARQLISGLRPPVLDEMGVVAAVRYMISEQTRGGPSIRFDADERLARLEPLLESTIFRIIQEAITNATRHSQSDRVEIHLTRMDDRIQLEVRDWGVGFDPASVGTGCFGLQGMRERARLLRGWTKIKSSPGEGTRVYVELPITPTLGEEANADD